MMAPVTSEKSATGFGATLKNLPNCCPKSAFLAHRKWPSAVEIVTSQYGKEMSARARDSAQSLRISKSCAILFVLPFSHRIVPLSLMTQILSATGANKFITLFLGRPLIAQNSIPLSSISDTTAKCLHRLSSALLEAESHQYRSLLI